LLIVESFAPWGWAHLIGGSQALAAGVGLLSDGHRWARTPGVVRAVHGCDRRRRPGHLRTDGARRIAER
jgi:hypothetical protein